MPATLREVFSDKGYGNITKGIGQKIELYIQCDSESVHQEIIERKELSHIGLFVSYQDSFSLL